MIHKQSTHAGFGAVGFLLALVVIAVLGFAGWTVYQGRPFTSNTSAGSSVASASHSQASSDQAAMAGSHVGDFSFSYPTSWTVATNTRPDEVLSIKSSDEQDGSAGVPVSGAYVDVYKKAISSSFFGSSLSEYMQNYGSEAPTSVAIAGQSGLKIDAKGVVAVAFTKDNDVYGVEEYYPAGTANPYPGVVDDIANSFTLSH